MKLKVSYTNCEKYIGLARKRGGKRAGGCVTRRLNCGEAMIGWSGATPCGGASIKSDVE